MISKHWKCSSLFVSFSSNETKKKNAIYFWHQKMNGKFSAINSHYSAVIWILVGKKDRSVISISVFIDMLSAFRFKYCTFLIETLLSTLYRCVVNRLLDRKKQIQRGVIQFKSKNRMSSKKPNLHFITATAAATSTTALSEALSKKSSKY